MNLTLTDEELQAIVDKVRDELRDEVYEVITTQIQQELSESYDYHEDRFRLSWMRMMESECTDLATIKYENACSHGRVIYKALFHVVEQYMERHAYQAQLVEGVVE